MKNFFKHFTIHKERYGIALIGLGISFLLGLLLDFAILHPDATEERELVASMMLFVGFAIGEGLSSLRYMMEWNLALAFGMSRKAFFKEYLLASAPVYLLVYPALLLGNWLERVVYANVLSDMEVVHLGERLVNSPLVLCTILLGIFAFCQVLMALWERFGNRSLWMIIIGSWTIALALRLVHRLDLALPEVPVNLICPLCLILSGVCLYLAVGVMIRKKVSF